MKNNNKGFTLAEMLIVVAIIGILIAILFPVFSDQLTKTKQAKNAANLRSAISEAQANALLNQGSGTANAYIDEAGLGDYANTISGMATITTATGNVVVTCTDTGSCEVK